VAEPPVASIGSRIRHRSFVAEQPEVPHLGRRQQFEHRVDHAESGAEDWNEPDPLTQLVRVGLLERGLHPDRRHAGVLERLVAEQPRQLAHHLTELLRLGVHVAQDRQLVLDGRMLRHVEIRVGHGNLGTTKSGPAGTVRSIVAKASVRPVARMTAGSD
jgi:hypothetical protein